MKFNIWEYEKKPLTDVLSFIVDNRGKSVPTVENGYKLIATNCIRNENLYPSYEKIRYLSEDVYQNWFRAHPLPGDIIFVCKGTPGRVCMVPDPIDFCIAQDMVALRVNKKIVYNKYLLVVLRSERIQKQIEQTSVGDVIPHFKKSFFDQILIPVPPMNIQKIVGNYYFSFSNKIECNNQINKNLEEQAKEIFKEWFIDNSENVGWKNGKFSDLITSTLSGDWGKDELSGNNTEKVYCIRGADIPEVKTGNKGKMPVRYIIPKNLQSKQLEEGDIVVEISGGSPSQSTGRSTVITQSLLDRYDSSIVCTNFCKALKPVKEYSMFIYYYFQYLYDKNIFFSYENGTTGIKNLDLTGFLETESIVIPPKNLIDDFHKFCTSSFNQIFANGKQSEQLSNIRDSLLPKLMSGELDVDNISI